MKFSYFKFWTLVFGSAFALALGAQTTTPSATPNSDSGPVRILGIDATRASEAPPAVALGETSKAPDGRTIEITNRYLVLDGKPALPVMGEFQYSRYPSEYWNEELLKMKAAGVQIVSAYVIWIHHEEIQNQFDWTGNRDLRRFVELCKKNNLLVVVRIGPYVHGEVRNGGLPDWVVAQGPTRRNDPAYLASVRRYYGQVGEQLRGELWKDGGNVIGVQLENEYMKRGPDEGAAHISELKKMAIDAGLIVPFYTVTGWGNPDFPAKEVVPVFGVYPDAFWESSLDKLPPNEGYSFSFRRDLGGITIDPNATVNADESSLAQYPYFLAEAGGGMQVAYHRRPVISAADVAALFVTHIGAGANLYGYYLFQGGSNPIGKKTTMQESAAVDGVYDLPIITYDFQAPLGEFGEVRPSYRILKEFHLFLNDFGSDLASMLPVAPAVTPTGVNDQVTPRYAARVGAGGGFLFVNNYIREYPMPVQKNVQFQVSVPSEKISLPRKAIDIPSGEYFIWPFRFDMNGVKLEYATAQLLCKLETGGGSYFFFFAQPGISTEFAFDSASIKSLRVFDAHVEREEGHTFLDHLTAGTNVAAQIVTPDGHKTNIVLLTSEQAKNIWKARVNGQERVLLSATDVLVDGNMIDLRSRDPKGLSVAAFPAFEPALRSANRSAITKRDGIFTSYAFELPAVEVHAAWKQTREAGPAPPPRRGKYNPLAPVEADFAEGAAYEITVPRTLPAGCSDLFLNIEYQGDVAHLYQGNSFIEDDFFHGEVWELGLKRFLGNNESALLQMKITPLRKDAPIFFEPGFRPDFHANSQLATVSDVTVVPEYELRLTAGKEAK